MKKKIGCLLVSLLMLTTSLNVTAFAKQGDDDAALNAQYKYTNNGYTLEKVSHADVAAGQNDGFVDYYQYTDPAGKVCTGVVEHMYVSGSDTPVADTAAELAKLREKLEAKYPGAGDEQIDRMLSEIEASLTGDACQSYAFSALGYGDWVYIGTMYGGTGITKHNAKTMFESLGLLKEETNQDGSTNQEAVEYNQKLVDNAVGLLYGDNYYTEHPVPTQGILFKMNVKTGESKIIMAGSVNGYQVTLRNAVAYNGRFYFIGTQVGTESVADAATGIPSIFEVNPEDDSFRTVYQAVDMDEYRAMQQAHVFPIPRAIAVYQGSLIASVTQMDGAHIIAYTPDAADFNADGSFKGIKDGITLRNPEFTEIAEQSEELLNYPAYHMYDANYGGTVYQMIEYDGKLYMAINAGQKALHSTLNPEEGVYTAVDPDTLEETKCYAGYAILEGTLAPGASPSDRSAWSWEPIIGNTQNDQWDDAINHADKHPAKYTFNIDPNRFAAAICTMEVYNGYLYIGDYNDVTQATYPMLQMDFIHLATLLSQSVNLYRMNGQHEIELVVGDKTQTFPNGSISGLESGYMGLNGHGSRINQYTSMTQIWDTDKTDDNDGVMLLGTLDEGSLLRPMIQIMNGDVLKMSEDEWKEKINYLKVLIQLLVEKNLGGDNATADLFADAAADDASSDDSALTAEEKVARALAAAQSFDLRNGAQLASEFDENVDPDVVSEPISLTPEQTASLVEGIKNGTIVPHSMDAGRAVEALSLTYGMSTITDLVSASGQENIEAFYEVYRELVEYYQDLKDSGYVELPEALEKVLDQVLTVESARQLRALLTCLNSVSTSVIGCDTYAITTDANGGNFAINEVTLDGLGDNSNQTMRNFALTDDYVVFIPGNAMRGGSVYRLIDWPGKQETPAPDPKPDPKPNPDPVPTPVPGSGSSLCTLHFETNGGSELKDLRVAAGTTVDLSKYVTEKTGFAFAGWYADKELTKALDTVKVTGYTTVYAKWACPFVDVTEKDWFYGDVMSMYEKGLMSGTSSNMFSPYLTTTRGMIVTILYRMEGSPAVSGASSFQDVKADAYYNNAVIWAAANGIVTGVSSTQFCPDNAITREQFAAILFRYAQYKGMDAVTIEENLAAFPDGGSVSGYAVSAMNWAVGAGLLRGDASGLLMPKGEANRAQAAAMLNRFIENVLK